MGISETYLSDRDDEPDWSDNPQTPEGFETFHRFLYYGAFVLFAMLAIDGFIIFPLMLFKYGWH